MPYKAEQGWIQGAELIPEYNRYKVDSSYRIIIPSYMKTKLNMDAGDIVEYYSAYIDGQWFLCVRRADEEYQLTKKEDKEKDEKDI